MLRKSLSCIATLFTAALFLGSSAVSHADSVTMSALSGPGGAVNLYTIASGASTPTGTVGWIYLGTADGAWFDGDLVSVQVTQKKNDTVANTVSFGWLYDAYPSVAFVTAKQTKKGTTVTATIVDYYNGAVYESTGEGDLTSGAVQITK